METKIRVAAILVFASFLNYGCANFGTPKEVSVPVQVPCISLGDIPNKQASLFEASKGKPWYERVEALLVDRANSIIYESQLEAIVTGCM